MTRHIRHLLDIEHLDDTEIRALIERTRALAGGAAPRPRAGTVANLFFEPSTRTRVSFEIAARRIGFDVVNIDHSGSSASKGESLADTVATLAAMDVDAVVLRHPDDRAAHNLVERRDGSGPSIVNAGSGCLAHPSQALLDAATLAAAGYAWPEMHVLLVGDIRHSRVARSDIALFERLGAAEIRIAGPSELMPEPGEMQAARRFDDLDAAIDGADVIICLRIQRERIAVTGYPDGETYHQRWGLTRERFERLGRHVRVLHPGPVNRGVEIAPEVVDSPRSLILEQVRTGVHLRTAVFEWLGSESPTAISE